MTYENASVTWESVEFVTFRIWNKYIPVKGNLLGLY